MRSCEKLRERAAISPASLRTGVRVRIRGAPPSAAVRALGSPWSARACLPAGRAPRGSLQLRPALWDRRAGALSPTRGIAVALRRDAPISRCHFAATSGGDSGVFRGILRRQLCIFTMRETRRNPANWWPQRDSNPCLVAVTFLPAVSRGSRHDDSPEDDVTKTRRV